MSEKNLLGSKAPIFLLIGDRKSGKTSIIANICRKKMDSQSLAFGVGLEFMEVNFKDRVIGVSFYETNFQNLGYAERIFANDFSLLSNLTIILIIESTPCQFNFSEIENKFRQVRTFIKNVTYELSEEELQTLRDRFLEVHGLYSAESDLLIPGAVVLHKFDSYLVSDMLGKKLNSIGKSEVGQIIEPNIRLVCVLFDLEGC